MAMSSPLCVLSSAHRSTALSDQDHILIYALSLQRPHRARETCIQRQSRFARSFVKKKELVICSKKHVLQLTHRVSVLSRSTESTKRKTGIAHVTVPSLERAHTTISARRTASSTRTLPHLKLHINTPSSQSISPSHFPTPLTPANQLIQTPSQPPLAPKGFPYKHARHWSPFVLAMQIDSNTTAMPSPCTPESPIQDIHIHFSRPLNCQVPRRLSYSQACSTPWTPNLQLAHPLASPVLIRKSLWAPSSPVTTPRYQLEELQFSPFRVEIF